MDSSQIDVQALHRLIHEAARRDTQPRQPDAAAEVTRQACAALLAAQQSAIAEAEAAFEALEAARRAGDRYAVARCLTWSDDAYDRARRLSAQVSAVLRQLLVTMVGVHRHLIPELQATGAASMAAAARLERRALSGSGGVAAPGPAGRAGIEQTPLVPAR